MGGGFFGVYCGLMCCIWLGFSFFFSANTSSCKTVKQQEVSQVAGQVSTRMVSLAPFCQVIYMQCPKDTVQCW